MEPFEEELSKHGQLQSWIMEYQINEVAIIMKLNWGKYGIPISNNSTVFKFKYPASLYTISVFLPVFLVLTASGSQDIIIFYNCTIVINS